MERSKVKASAISNQAIGRPVRPNPPAYWRAPFQKKRAGTTTTTIRRQAPTAPAEPMHPGQNVDIQEYYSQQTLHRYDRETLLVTQMTHNPTSIKTIGNSSEPIPAI